MAISYFGRDVDTVFDCESATLPAGWSLGPSWNLGRITLPSTSFPWRGNGSIAFDQSAEAWAQYDIGSAVSAVCGSMSIRVDVNPSQGGASFFLQLLDASGASLLTAHDGRTYGDVRDISMSGAAGEVTDIRIADSTQYYIQWMKGATTFTMIVRNADHSLRGTLVAPLTTAVRYVRIGSPRSDGYAKTIYIDDAVIDVTNDPASFINGWSAVTTYSVTYNANTATHGAAPTDSTAYTAGQEATVAARPVHMVKTGRQFARWNTAADGSGTAYAPGAKISMSANVILYAQWTAYAATSKIIRHGKHDPSVLSSNQVAAAAVVDFLFEHASVGRDIVGDSDTDSSTGTDSNGSLPCGLALLHTSNPRYLMSRDSEASAINASWFASYDGLEDNMRGNPGASAKISGFTSSLTTLGTAADAAGIKFCFIDGPSDPDALFDAYVAAAAGWTSTLIIHFTMPIEISGNTGYNPTGRQAYNDMLRQWVFDGDRWLFDLADLESDGGTVLDSSNREVLASSYSLDGGHLTAAGKLKMAGAFWRLLAAISGASASYTVTFNSEGGSSVSSQTVAYGGHASAPADPTRTGYTFGGWYADEALTDAWSFTGDTVTADMTLYAKWTAISYTVGFDSQGGSTVASQSVAYGGHVTAPAAPTRTGYTFGGWYTEAACTTAWNFSTGTITAARTLYAKWTLDSTPVGVCSVSADDHAGDDVCEGSTKAFVLSFFDEAGAAMAPDSITWSLYNGSGELVGTRENVPITTGATVRIVLSGLDHAVTMAQETRRLVVKATYTSTDGDGLPLVAEYRYPVTQVTGI